MLTTEKFGAPWRVHLEGEIGVEDLRIGGISDTALGEGFFDRRLGLVAEIADLHAYHWPRRIWRLRVVDHVGLEEHLVDVLGDLDVAELLAGTELSRCDVVDDEFADRADSGGGVRAGIVGLFHFCASRGVIANRL